MPQRPERNDEAAELLDEQSHLGVVLINENSEVFNALLKESIQLRESIISMKANKGDPKVIDAKIEKLEKNIKKGDELTGFRGELSAQLGITLKELRGGDE